MLTLNRHAFATCLTTAEYFGAVYSKLLFLPTTTQAYPGYPGGDQGVWGGESRQVLEQICSRAH